MSNENGFYLSHLLNNFKKNFFNTNPLFEASYEKDWLSFWHSSASKDYSRFSWDTVLQTCFGNTLRGHVRTCYKPAQGDKLHQMKRRNFQVNRVRAACKTLKAEPRVHREVVRGVCQVLSCLQQRPSPLRAATRGLLEVVAPQPLTSCFSFA